jgi:long-subunit acyl-CoA synthetase (AMP-forming)/acyl carrier protein
MDLNKLLERLESFPERNISFYDEAGALVRKSYPSVGADVRAAMEKLRGWGVEAGMRVGILAGNSYEWVVHDLALFNLGCTSVAFPDEFGQRTSLELIEKYGLALLLISKRDHWPNISANQWTIYLEADNSQHVRVHPDAWRAPDGEFIPTLTFSSGTSGRIKCLITNQRGAEETIAGFYKLFEITGEDSFLVFLPLSSFQQRLMIYAGFFYGFDIQLVSPTQVLAAFKEMRPTLCLAPPLLYETVHAKFNKAVQGLSPSRRLMLRAMSTLAEYMPLAPVRRKLIEACYGKVYESLGGRIRLMWTGMAPIKNTTLDFFRRMRLPLYEAYGLTECGAITTNTPRHQRRGSVGRPITEGSVVLAPDGEIMVRQEHLQTTGYLECDADEEARTFVAPNTVATGDIGYFDRDGYLYLKGRKKEIIITEQGYKVHPESLESLIDRCPQVERSVVFGTGLPYLVALISIQEPKDEEATARIAKSIEKINADLPPVSQIVKYFITTEQLTRENGLMTRNLKLDRRAIFRHFKKDLLGNLAPHEKSSERHDAAPETLAAATTTAGTPQAEFEQSISAIWQEVLQTTPIGLNDNFFELGGNSLLLAEIQQKMQDKLGQAVPLAEMFNHPTVGSLAKYLASSSQQQTQEAQAAPQPVLQRINDRAEKQREALSRQRQSRERKKVS